MEIFMHNIPPSYDDLALKDDLAFHIHKLKGGKQMNFAIHLHYNRAKGHTRTGILTIPILRVAKQFMYNYGCTSWRTPQWTLTFENYVIGFCNSVYEPSPALVTSLSTSRWVPIASQREQRELERREREMERELEKKQREKANMIQEAYVGVETVQFGWMCRDDIFSIESEFCRETIINLGSEIPNDPGFYIVRESGGEIAYSKLCFDDKRRELRVVILEESHIESIIAIQLSSILSISFHNVCPREDAIFIQIETPPSFFQRNPSQKSADSDPSGKDNKQTLSLVTTLSDFDNPSAIPYASLVLRLVLPPMQWNQFSKMAGLVGLRRIENYSIRVSHERKLFSNDTLELLQYHFQQFDWCIAFQLENLIRKAYMDGVELLSLIPEVSLMVSECRNPMYVASLLRAFGIPAKDYLPDKHKPTMLSCFTSFAQKFARNYRPIADEVLNDPNLFQSYHVIVTPTSMFLTGPYPEKSNRVIRKYDKIHQECFLRVSFRDEKEHMYRYDPDVKSQSVISTCVKPHMTQGLLVAGRCFNFLGYSMSALNAHSVWFVKSFTDNTYGFVDAQKIIQSLGIFRRLLYDKNLIHQPARYGARISQAFSATDAYNSENTTANIVIVQDDIKTEDGKYNFTDGCGGISPAFARSIWEKLGKNQGARGATSNYFPQAFQIRFQGSKGMLCVDDNLPGDSTIALRPSMIKFEAPSFNKVEIARIVDHPTMLLLNRPLIMVLEQLGVPYTTFKHFQDQAVGETQRSTRSLHDASLLLQKHGLGASFRIPTTILNLAKLGVMEITSSEYPFYKRLLEVGIFHILRELKHHSRIPIPNAWNLVGVADNHKYLREGEVFVAIRNPNPNPQAVDGNGNGKVEVGVKYLKGTMIISRSPVVHPGDVQIVTAIGKPPERSCFEKFPLFNTIVFSVLGERPLSTCLGGGDLDGDEYNIIPLEEHPSFTLSSDQIISPAEYTPSKKRKQKKRCTMEDVAQFVMDYMINDTIGVVATHWLMFADRDGICSEDCLELAQLHSDAVDYRKTGMPVSILDIPKFMKRDPRPDWMAHETETDSWNFNKRYYESQRAIGKLARAINLDSISKSVGVGSATLISTSTSTSSTAAVVVENINSETLSSLTISGSGDSRSQSRTQRPQVITMDTITNILLREIEIKGYQCSTSLSLYDDSPTSSLPRPKETINFIEQLFTQFSTELQEIAISCNIQRLPYYHRRNATLIPLSEEEMIIGTVITKIPQHQHRIRQDKIGKLRERTEDLGERLRNDLKKNNQSGVGVGVGDYLEHVWIAWLVYREECKKEKDKRRFGVECFGWVVLGAVFDALRLL